MQIMYDLKLFYSASRKLAAVLKHVIRLCHKLKLRTVLTLFIRAYYYYS